MRRYSVWVLLGLALFTVSLHDLQVNAEAGPSESECRPYIERAINDLKAQDDSVEASSQEIPSPETIDNDDSRENVAAEETSAENVSQDETDNASVEEAADDTAEIEDTTAETEEASAEEQTETNPDAESEEASDVESEQADEPSDEASQAEGEQTDSDEVIESSEPAVESVEQSEEPATESAEESEEQSEEAVAETTEESVEEVTDSAEPVADSTEDSAEQVEESVEASDEPATESGEESTEPTEEFTEQSAEAVESVEETTEQVEETVEESAEVVEETAESVEASEEPAVESVEESNEASEVDSTEQSPEAVEESVEETVEAVTAESADVVDESEEQSAEAATTESPEQSNEQVDSAEPTESVEETTENVSEQASEETEGDQTVESTENETAEVQSEEALEELSTEAPASAESAEPAESVEESVQATEQSEEVEEASIRSKRSIPDEEPAPESTETEEKVEEVQADPLPEEDLLMEFEIPKNLRDKSHIYELLNIKEESSEKDIVIKKTADVLLRDLKRIYDNAIKPLETLYKYRDLSNRHFGDPEIFSKPLVLFMGPWSGGKSTILNYLTHNEHTQDSVRTGAEPSPAYFNILMHGDEPEVLDGTQLAADWTFSGLQKFGQGLLDRLRGQKLPNKLLEKVNIVEIPGILEVRKQVSQYFPFNDACQWFIDRADIIFLVYDPSKLDVGPETEAILDQLKGREYQTRILLNKADQVKPEELLRVQGALIWNISPLMSSAQPPVMYTVSMWSHPFEVGAPVRLLQAQERQLLLDLGNAIDKRIENKISSARRFAVRVRNHAKMVDCYLTTYYNHKTLFGNKKLITDKIIENPQQYHIYEGLSTLTNISRYDLPDPEVYRDFFRLNPLFQFQKLSETCTYFRGCPINKLDIAIAYDLPELVGKYKKLIETSLGKLIDTTSKSKS